MEDKKMRKTDWQMLRCELTTKQLREYANYFHIDLTGLKKKSEIAEKIAKYLGVKKEF